MAGQLLGLEIRGGTRRRPAVLSGRLASLFYGWLFTEAVIIPKEAEWGSSVCALAKAQKLASGLPSRSGTGAAQRAARQVFDGVNATPGDIDNRVLAVCYALNAGFPNLLKHVQAHDYEGNGCKSKREKRKGRYELAHKIELQRENDP
jgi:hypothetical protein